jgi:hypothetical protein
LGLCAFLFFSIQLAISVIAVLSAVRILLSCASGLSAALAHNGKANINIPDKACRMSNNGIGESRWQSFW